MMCARQFFFSLVLLMSIGMSAQRNEILSTRIASLQVVAGDRWLSPPVMELKSDDRINISFDDLTHEYHRYVYRLEHCEADWSISEDIFQSDYCDGFADGNTIDDCTESINTNILYTHYSLRIPNDRCRIKMSGNYRVTIYDENSGEEAATACFMVVEPVMNVQMVATTNTDVEINKTKQQISLQVNYGGIRITNPKHELKTVVMQNGRWDNAVINPQAQFFMPNGMRWSHNADLIFNGGNEYRKFETLDVTHTTMGLESVAWDGHDYNAYVWTDEPRPAYVYDEDANGAFYIRNSDNIENDYGSEYLLVHFRLKTPPTDNDIFINAVWTNDRFLPIYQMEYNAESKCYEKTVLLKQGYYSYQYLMRKSDTEYVPVPTEGNFCYTENKYQCLVYYRGVGQRTDRLVGYAQVRIN
ncbi:MAG: DUF5103 domain-containing protein [Prevotella sp.]